MIFWEILAGVLGGIIAGMGMGGGTLTIPILTIFLHYKQLNAQGINLVAFLPTSIVALGIHIKNKLVQFKQTWLLALIGCIFCVGGAILANHISNSLLKKIFAMFLILLAVWQLIEFIKELRNKKQNHDNYNKTEDKNVIIKPIKLKAIKPVNLSEIGRNNKLYYPMTVDSIKIKPNGLSKLLPKPVCAQKLKLKKVIPININNKICLHFQNHKEEKNDNKNM